MTLREGDIASTYMRSAIACANNACLWPKSIDGFVYIPYILSPLYGAITQFSWEVFVYLFTITYLFIYHGQMTWTESPSKTG